MSSTGVTSPVKAAIQGTKSNSSQVVQIVKLPAALQQSATAIRLEGQVTAQNDSNNTVRIQTQQGDIDVQIRGNKQPQVGQRIEVEIPAGRPPIKATIRTDTPPQNGKQAAQNSNSSNNPAAQTQNTARDVQGLSTRVSSQAPQNSSGTVNTSAGPNPTGPSPQTQAPQNTAPNAAQVSPNATQASQGRQAQALPPALQEALVTQNTNISGQATRAVTSEATIRLLSVAPAQAQNIAKEYVQTLPQPAQNIATQNAVKPNLLVQNISVSNPPVASPTLSTIPPQVSTSGSATVTPSPQQSLQFTTTQTPASISNSIPTNTVNLIPTNTAQSVAPQTTSFLQPTILNTSTPLNQGQILPTNIPNNFITPSAPNTAQPVVQPSTALGIATLTPITFDPANPNSSPTRPIGQIDVNIVKITPPNAIIKAPLPTGVPTPAPIPATTQFTPPLIGANSAITLNATVTGFTAQGLPLVTVQGLGSRLPQSFVLQQAGSNLQLGSQLQILPKNGVPISTQISPVTLRTFNNPLLQGFQFPALDELYNSMLQVSSQAAASLSRSLPTPGNPAQIGAAAMVFIAAVKSGDMSAWLGDKKIDMLQQSGRSNLLSRLVQNSASGINAPEAATTTSEWRAVPMPMFWESEIHRITLYTRQEGQGDNQHNQSDNGQTRFIFDLNLTRMGDVQIDGLIKGSENGKRLDLVVRTQNSFSQPMQATMRQAYTNALSQTELTGELNFQGSTKNWVNVLEKSEQLGVSI